MAPSHSRLLLAWSFPTIVLLSYLWYKRKRIGARSDPGGTENPEIAVTIPPTEPIKVKEPTMTQPVPIEQKKFSRSLSGVESAPIDIIMPRDMRSIKSNATYVSDEDLDEQIEKVKPPKNTHDIYTISKQAAEKTIESPKKTSPPVSPMIVNNSNNNNNNNNLIPKKKTNKNKKSTAKKNQINNENTRTNVNNCENNVLVNGNTDATTTDKAADPPVRERKPKRGPHKKAQEKKPAAESNLNINCEEFVPRSLEKADENAKVKTEEPDTSPDSSAQRQRSNSSDERDSANHSPVDQLLASPSLSNISDQDSLDSGKGGSGSEIIGSPLRNVAPQEDLKCELTEKTNEDLNHTSQELIPHEEVQQMIHTTLYDFLIPQDFVGKFIGKGGYAINEIKRKSNTSIVIRAHPHNKEVKICVIEGYQDNINTALKLIRDKFPVKKYPNITLEQTYLAIPPNYQLNTDSLYLRLIPGINNDTVVSCIVKPNYVFLQQYTHPTHHYLQTLTVLMNSEYAKPESPMVAFPAPENSVCAGFSVNQWYRVLILSNDIETQKAYVAFLDYGGYAFIDYFNLRQIRADFLTIPFQAQGCILHGIRPKGEANEWPKGAFDSVRSLTLGHVCVTQIIGSTSWDEPLVCIYIKLPTGKWVNLNEELVNLDFAEHTDSLEDDAHHPLWVKCHMEDTVAQLQTSEQYPDLSNSNEGAVGGVSV